MSRRYVSLWLPHWPVERWRLARQRRGHETYRASPFVLIRPEAGGPILFALSKEAAATKLSPGMRLADARAVCPGLKVEDAELEADSTALQALALCCGRYSPWTAVDGDDGVVLDITGCAHLFGGEATLLAELKARVRAHGFTVRAATAGNPAAAWAWARLGAAGILPSSRTESDLAPLPLAALRLDADTVAALYRLGLRTIGQLDAVPAAPLMARFGALPIERLHALMGRTRIPFVPLSEPAALSVRLNWAEPLGSDEAIVRALTAALDDLAERLERMGEGVRRLCLDLARLDGAVHRLEVRTSRPNRDPKALLRLFRDDLDGLDLGFGIECLHLAAPVIEPLTARQLEVQGGEADEAEALAALIDRLSQRLGAAQVQRPVPVDSHLPERAVAWVPALAAGEKEQASSKQAKPAAPPAGTLDLTDPNAAGWLVRPPRPLRLFETPLPAGALAELPDHPPVRLHWRGAHRVVAEAQGPERLEPEWWRGCGDRSRDYYRLDCKSGRRLWVYREGAYGDARPPRWFVHGTFN